MVAGEAEVTGGAEVHLGWGLKAAFTQQDGVKVAFSHSDLATTAPLTTPTPPVTPSGGVDPRRLPLRLADHQHAELIFVWTRPAPGTRVMTTPPQHTTTQTRDTPDRAGDPGRVSRSRRRVARPRGNRTLTTAATKILRMTRLFPGRP